MAPAKPGDLGKPDAGNPPVRFDEGRELADSPRPAPAYSTPFGWAGRTGLIYTNLGPAKLELFPLAEPELKSVAHFEIAPDKAEHALEFHTNLPGLHRLEVSDGTQGTLINWAPGLSMTIVSSQEQPAKLYGPWHL